jgi:putative ABC transport system permease protein
MHNFYQDLRYGIRMLAKSPGFTLASIVCLALGIGATTAIFSIVDAVLIRPLPYASPGRLVRVYSEFPKLGKNGMLKFWISPPEFLDLRRYTTTWESIEGWVNGGANLAGGNEPIRVTASNVTGGLLNSLGIAPIMGRTITPQDDKEGAPQVAVLSYGLWQRAFGADRRILGRDVLLSGRKATIIGVMPKSFQFPPGEIDSPELWTPLQISPNSRNRGNHFLSVLGRLKTGASIEQARSEIQQLQSHWKQTAPPKTHVFDGAFHYVVMYPFHDEVVGSIRLAMLVLFAAVGFVLLIACVNVANLLLARAEARQREIAIRKALGAGVSRLAAQFVTEGVALSLLGALLGLGLAFIGLRIIIAMNAGSIPRAQEIAINTPVLLFTLAVSFATGIGFGLAPLAQLITQNVHDTLKAAASRTTATVNASRFRRFLVIGELALALMLLIGTGLMIRAFWKLQQVEIGLKPDHILTMRVALPQAVYPENQRVVQFWTELQQRASRIPGATSVTMMSGLPPSRQLDANDTAIEGWVPGSNSPPQNVDYWQPVGDRFFETLGVRLIEGRFFDERDGENAPKTVIVNQTMAQTFWPGRSAIGRRVGPGAPGDWRTIVGVVGDVKNAGVDQPTGTELFFPFRQTGGRGIRSGYLVLRAGGDPVALAGPARREIHALDPGLPISSVRTMDDVLVSAQSRPRFLTTLLTLFSGVALVLAAVGLYGVISYSVAQRTSEFGIRIAMGAGSRDVLRMVVGQGLRLGVIGVVLGAAGALALTRLIRGLLFGISSFDPQTFVAMAVLLTGVTLLACYIPARRATRVDPMVALRYE